MYMNIGYSYPNQHGMALVISLIFLVVLTALGIFAIQNNTLQERMAGNYRNQHIAFEAAELALRVGEEATIQRTHAGSPISVLDNNSTDPWNPEYWLDAVTNNSAKAHQLEAGSAPHSSQQPIFFLEEIDMPLIVDTDIEDPVTDAALDGSLEPERTQNLYRITAIGFGGTDDAVIILQSTFYR